MEDCWGREKESLWEMAGLQGQPPQSLRQPIPAHRKSSMVEGQYGWTESTWFLSSNIRMKYVCLFLNQQFCKTKPRTKDLYCFIFLSLKNYSPMFLNACIIFLKWDENLCKPLKLAVPGQWPPHNSALVSFSPQLLLGGISKCPLRCQQTWCCLCSTI